MKKFKLINHIQTAVSVINKDMTVIEANDAFQQRNSRKKKKVIGSQCFKSAYNFSESCIYRTNGFCPVAESFKTKKSSSAVHHFWINNNAVVEEVTTTPIIDENGDVTCVVEEFRDLTELLGLNKGIIGICSYCRKVRNKDGVWVTFEAYIQKSTGANFSHGICEECNETLLNEFDE